MLTESADFLYKCTDYYHPESELSLAWDDSTIGVQWPIPEGTTPRLSVKDQSGVSWENCPLFPG